MKEYNFKILGSTGEEYSMYVKGNYAVRCFCRAGKHRTLCKHVIAIASLDFESLLDPDDEQPIRDLLEPTTILADMGVIAKDIKALERQVAKLNNEKKKLKQFMSTKLGVTGDS